MPIISSSPPSQASSNGPSLTRRIRFSSESQSSQTELPFFQSQESRTSAQSSQSENNFQDSQWPQDLPDLQRFRSNETKQTYFIAPDPIVSDEFQQFYKEKGWPSPEMIHLKINWNHNRKSPAWEHFRPVVNIETGEPGVVCAICESVLKHPSIAGTSAMGRHYATKQHAQGVRAAIERSDHPETPDSRSFATDQYSLISTFIEKNGMGKGSVCC